MTTVGLLRHTLMTALFLGALAPLFFAADTTEATPWSADYSVSLANPAAGANSDIVSDLTIPAPNYNFAALVGFTPPQFTVAKGEDIPIGAIVGELTSTATLGLINNACLTPVIVPFQFVNASLNTADTIEPLPSGTDDRLSNIAADANGNGIPDGADQYPSWLNNIFPGKTPRARMFGEHFIQSASTTVILNLMIFDPGITLDPPGPEPPITFDPALGYPSVTVLQTLGDPTESPSPGSITDFCTKLIAMTTVFGETKDNPNTGANEAGLVWRTNPAQDGSYNFVNYFQTQRDADEDGIENGMDPCPFDVDTAWNPRTMGSSPQPGADEDGDGIPNTCDKELNTQLGVLEGELGAGGEVDNYQNRGDNCPQVTNGVIPFPPFQIVGPNNQKDDDLDGIGNECDPNPQTPDGHRHVLCASATVSVGAGGGTPIPAVTSACPEAAAGAPTSTPTVGPGTPTVGPATPTVGPGTPTVGPGTPTAGPGSTDGIGGPDTGVGALAPAAGSIPAWAAIASGLGGAGFLSAAGALVSRVFRRRRS